MSLRIETPRDLQEVMRTAYTVSAQQWDAISAPLAPAVVIAGAGSGKTTLMAARVVYLVATGQVTPEQVLGLTFTTKAAGQLATSIREALRTAGLLAPALDDPDDVDVVEPTVATYNSYASALLSEHGLRIGFEPDTRVLADASRFQVAAAVVAAHRGPIAQLSDHPDTVIANMLALESAMSEHLVSADRIREHAQGWRPGFHQARLDELAGKARSGHLEAIDKALGAMTRRGELLELVEEYREAKRRHGLMDFAEQIEWAAQLASTHPEVGACERERFKVVLLDEYQDTSVAQALLLARLFGDGHPVTAVGDPNQAIYGWRGASVSNILNFGDDFPHPDGVRVYPLTVSRRSAPVILQVANLLAEPLYAASDSLRPLDPDPAKSGGQVRVQVFETQPEELRALTEGVRAAHEAMTDPQWREIGVLTRDNKSAEAAFDALSEAGIPVEIVGLSGLLRLPEVAQVLAVLRLIHDVTANADMLTVLSGPRWAIGPRDLALLGRRARELADVSHVPTAGLDVDEELAVCVVGSDPSEVASLSEAVADPGEAAYSPEARERFGLLAAELRHLRAYAGEPLLDLVRRVIDVTGIDVELASSLSPAASARRDNLDLFIKAVADFEAIDGEVSLTALLAWLKAEDEFGNGLDAATPSEADSVKLLTVHRAKGLEWQAAFVIGVCETTFPSTRGRWLWVTSPAVLPSDLRGDARDLPHLSGYTKEAIEAYRNDCKAHDLTEELRLAYVAVTRPAQTLSLSAYLWGARPTPFGPSSYLTTIRDAPTDLGVDTHLWLDRPGRGVPNPLLAVDHLYPWPGVETSPETERRQTAAAWVTDRRAGRIPADLPVESPTSAMVIADWDREIQRLLDEALTGQDATEVTLPSTLSATALSRLRDDPDGFARDLARPMPRQPSPSARFGTRFHAWVESRFGQLGLLDPDDLPGRADTDIDDDEDLRDLIQRFASGPFAERRPVAVEAPFALVLAGQVIRGRIDAVYSDGDGFLLVDWKTNRAHDADPLQLAIYREAWAELTDTDPAEVRAAFHYVRSGETLTPPLPDRAELEELVRPSRN